MLLCRADLRKYPHRALARGLARFFEAEPSGLSRIPIYLIHFFEFIHVMLDLFGIFLDAGHAAQFIFVFRDGVTLFLN